MLSRPPSTEVESQGKMTAIKVINSNNTFPKMNASQTDIEADVSSPTIEPDDLLLPDLASEQRQDRD